MISDTLSDAAHDIREYLEIYPRNYASVQIEIERVLVAMDALRSKLDAPIHEDMPVLQQCQACGGHPEEQCSFCGQFAR